MHEWKTSEYELNNEHMRFLGSLDESLQFRQEFIEGAANNLKKQFVREDADGIQRRSLSRQTKTDIVR